MCRVASGYEEQVQLTNIAKFLTSASRLALQKLLEATNITLMISA